MLRFRRCRGGGCYEEGDFRTDIPHWLVERGFFNVGRSSGASTLVVGSSSSRYTAAHVLGQAAGMLAPGECCSGTPRWYWACAWVGSERGESLASECCF